MHPTRTTGHDRAELEGLADGYMDALLARDPGRLPLADTVRFTENGVDLQPGEGLWALARAPSAPGGPVSFLAPHLLKLRDGQIVRVESAVKPVPYRMPSGWD